MDGMNKDKIREAVSQLKHEDEAYHESMIERLIHEYDEYSASCEGYGTDSIESVEFKKVLTESDLDICLIDNENLDKKPAAKKEPIKNTHVHDTSVGTTNVDPVVTGAGIIGQGGG